MIRSVEPDNPTEECNTGVEEQHPLTRKMQPDMLTPEEDIPQNYIDDYARVTFTTEMMIARLSGLEDLLKRRERPGEGKLNSLLNQESYHHISLFQLLLYSGNIVEIPMCQLVTILVKEQH